ncbi:GAF domain-containing protein [Streptomyces sp. B8F3]|uniref:GAF domain-containing protein n=1 Tax=unclassified Streptomyces TaxID=2593676 RepID=UPI00325DD88D
MDDRFTVRQSVFDTAAGGGPGGLPGRLCRLLRGDLAMDAVTISLLGHGPYQHVCYASDAAALDLEALHFAPGEGPSVRATTLGRPVAADLRRHRGLWPALRPPGRTQPPDAGALYAFPLRFRGRVLGSIGLIRHTPGALSEEEYERCAAAADAVAVVLVDDFHHLGDDSPPSP